MKHLVSSCVALACASVLLALAPPAARANPPLESLYSGLHWRFIGPYSGGRVTAVAGVPSQPDTFYAGAAGGGLWKTQDDGTSWKPIFDKEPALSMGAVAVAPSNPSIVYVGTGEYDMRSSIVAGDGVYKSTDAGKTWAHLGLTDTQQIGRIAIDPRNPNRVYLAALGHAYAANEERGVYRSSDGGKTWEKVLYRNADTGAIDLAIDPHNSSIIYASLWQTRRPPWNIYPASNGPGSGLYKSIDGGTTWKQLTAGLPTKGLGKIGIAVARSAPGVLYVIADAQPGGLYRSNDYGEHWNLVNRVLSRTGSYTSYVYDRGWYFDDLAIDPHNANTIYVGTVQFERSTNGGKRFAVWNASNNNVADCHQTWVNPSDSNRMIIGCDQGAIVTINGGKQWSTRFVEPFGEYYRVAVDNAFPYNVYGAQQDNFAVKVPSRTNHSAITIHDFDYITAGGESSYIAPDPLHPNILYGENGGAVSREDTSVVCSGCITNADITPSLAFPGAHRQTWTLPLVFSQHNKHVLYYAQEVLWRTADRGASWQKISPDLTSEAPGTPANLHPPTEALRQGRAAQGVIHTIAP